MLISVRRQIHSNPELGNKEFDTTKLIMKILTDAGIKNKKISDTGVVALIGERKKGKCIALRGDIDALPIQEKTGKPYASKNIGVMHACGHDANCTMVLGAALLLNDMKDCLKGPVKFIFQPNEENADGAKKDNRKKGFRKT